MKTITIKFTHPAGLHARPSCQLATIAKNVNATVCITRDGRHTNIRSILDILSLAIGPGEVIFEADGPEADKALEQIQQAFDSNFDQYD